MATPAVGLRGFTVQLHEQLRQLTQQLGSRVLEDADEFRAAADDYLDEGAATRGQVNLLVDAIRLGGYSRLVESLDRHADPEEAIEDAGRWLAAERGTTDIAGSRWACTVLAFASGRLDAVGASADQLLGESATLPAPPPSPDSGPDRSGGGDAVVTIPADEGAPPLLVPDQPSNVSGQPLRLVRATASVALLAAVVAGGATLLDYFEHDDYGLTGWSRTGTPGEIDVRYGVPVTCAAVILALAAAVVLARPQSRRGRAVLAMAAVALATTGLLLGIVLGRRRSTDDFVSAGSGLWLMLAVTIGCVIVASYLVVGVQSRDAAGSTMTVRPPVGWVWCLVIALLALGVPWLIWFTFGSGPSSVNGWGVVDAPAGSEATDQPRYGFVLVGVAVLEAGVLIALRGRRQAVGGTAPAVAAVAASIGLALAGWNLLIRLHVVFDTAREVDYAAGTWVLTAFGIICLAHLVVLLAHPPTRPPSQDADFGRPGQ